MEIDCDQCHKIYKIPEYKYLSSKTGLRFCSRDCKDQSQLLESKLNKLISPNSKGTSYRAHALRVYGAICKMCGYKEYKKMLDVDHIDSNRKNNDIANLQVLCVWCHALKTRKVKFHVNRTYPASHLQIS